jgi:hypothetical protein
MKEFINKNVEMISRILEIEGFNQEKLENILEIISNKKIHFDFAGACPYGFYLNVTLEKRINHLQGFIDFLKEKELYKEDYKIFSGCLYEYEIIIDKDKPSEVIIRFNNPKQ